MNGTIDKRNEKGYNIDKQELIAKVKTLSIELSKQYGCNIRVEVDANGQVESAKVKVTEFL